MGDELLAVFVGEPDRAGSEVLARFFYARLALGFVFGDEAGVAGGVASGIIKGPAEFMLFSFTVQIEGSYVPRSMKDPMLYNNKNTPPFPVLQPPVP